ncbi:hypothetical protein INT47_010469 [Mucor saturninus]|uniref:Uncharacterized protein n=1 Tax=Mucor saturninus TaxID=64648 RepID=A0A8H7RD78_9FUNG|nr:hypothetical protein INT47_010469 [Mucor saturninus]
MNSEDKSNLPKHMPIDMAYAPEQNPYGRTRVIHTPPNGDEEQHKLAQHSLSPEKLGLVGYVKDVAGFVKDAVQERRRSNSVSSIEDKQESPKSTEEKPRRRSLQPPQPPQQQHSAFSDAVTGLFPGVHTIGDVNASGCTHADELRNQMMHVHDNKLL